MWPELALVALCSVVNDDQRPAFHHHLSVNIIRKPFSSGLNTDGWLAPCLGQHVSPPTLVSSRQRVSLCHSHRLWPPLSSQLPLKSRNLSISQGPAIRGLDCGKLIHNHTVLSAFYPAASSSPLKRPAVSIFTCCLLEGFLCCHHSVSLHPSSLLWLPQFSCLSFTFSLPPFPVWMRCQSDWPFPRPVLSLCKRRTHTFRHTSDQCISAFDCDRQLHTQDGQEDEGNRGKRVKRRADDRMSL